MTDVFSIANCLGPACSQIGTLRLGHTTSHGAGPPGVLAAAKVRHGGFLFKRYGGPLAAFVAIIISVSASTSAVAQSRTESRSDAESESVYDEGPTAEDVLRALQRTRPTTEVLYPIGSPPSGSEDGASPLLLFPEGMTIVEQRGFVERTGGRWRFVFDPAEDIASVYLLPSAVLEVMIRTAAGARKRVLFVVSGELTVYEERNYLLPRAALRVTRPQPDARLSSQGNGAHSGKEPPQPTDSPQRSPTRSDSEASTSSVDMMQESSPSRQGEAPESVEDVLAALRAAQPEYQAMTPAEVRPDVDPGRTDADSLPPQGGDDHGSVSIYSGDDSEGHRRNAGAEWRRALRPDGTIYARRSGRVVSREGRWYFTPQADHPDSPEPPLELLPCQATEFMIQTWRRDPHGLVFTVSGELTLFQGENYLLPRMATRSIVTDNLRK